MEREPTAACATVGRVSEPEQPIWLSSTALLIYMALATAILHLLVGNRYGFHCDELATLEDSRHLAWGYPAYPPVTPFFGRISLMLFGTSLTGFRLFASLAQATAVVLAGFMAREMGGGRTAQLVAAAAGLPGCIGAGALMQYVSFDYLAWVLAAYFIIRVLRSTDQRWWMAVGASIGFGMLSKYTMAFLVVAIIAGLVLTDARCSFKSKWLWIAAAIALVVWLPNLLWQWRHDFVSFDFLKYIHARDVWLRRHGTFITDQLLLTYLPLVAAGLYFFFSRRGRRFRMVGWMYAGTLLLFLAAKGRSYYLYPAYPMIYAGGAVWGERWLANRTVWIVLACGVVFATAFFLPLAPVNSGWWTISSSIQETYVSEIGWPELVGEVARIRDSLPPAEQEHLGILATRYGEAGAINLFGPQYGLPRAISGVNSFWERGYGDPAPRTLIVIGQPSEAANEQFESCRVAGRIWNRYGVKNDETVRNPEIFVCGAPKLGWPEFWRRFRSFA